MKKTIVSLLGLALIAILSNNTSAQVIFSDNFNSPDEVGSNGTPDTLSAGIATAGRQGGTDAPLGYTVTGTYYYNQIASDTLNIVSGNGILSGNVSPNANFNDFGTPGSYSYIDFSVDPTTAPGGGWAGIVFGSNAQNTVVNNNDGGFGILFRSTGAFTAFNSSNTEVGSGTFDSGYTAGTFENIDLRITDPLNGLPYVGAPLPVTIQAFANGDATPFFTYTTTTEFSNNYISFNSDSDGSGVYASNAFDNLQIGIAAVPEPSTWAMMLGGLGILFFVLRRRLGSLV